MAKKKTKKKSGVMENAFNHPKSLIVGIAIGLVILSYSFMSGASASNGCDFKEKGNKMTLNKDCVTDETIVIPDGMTLDGRNRTITAVDPSGDHFRGAVVRNGGDEAHVKNLTVTSSNLSNTCDSGADRLRGIMFEGASGSIVNNKVININQGKSGCQEGNAIEVRNAPFNLDHPDVKDVEIAHNEVEKYQKTGIVANGDVNASIHHNKVGSADLSESLAANSIQVGFGAIGSVMQNQIEGNQWCGQSNFAASAILLYQSDSSDVSKNIIGGNSDIAIYAFTNNTFMDNNKITDEGEDCNQNGHDVGIGDYDAYTEIGENNNSVTNNKVSGFNLLYEEVEGGGNKAPGEGPQKGNPWF